MPAIQLHMTGGHLRGRVIAIMTIVLLLGAVSLGIALLGVHGFAFGGVSTTLETFEVRTPAWQAEPPATPSLFDADGVSQSLPGPDEISAASRSRA